MGSAIHRFQGYWMRSHSETRWASMMDALGIRWIYEPRIIETRHGWYLPDFFLPCAGVYLEVKGPAPTQAELEKGRDLQEATGCPVLFAWGDMTVDGDGVCGGMVGAIGPSNLVKFSMYEFKDAIRVWLGERSYWAYMNAGLKIREYPVVYLADALQELLLNMQGRSAAEKSRAEHHRELNRPRIDAHGVASRSEWAVSTFLRRNPGPGVRTQEVAA